VAAFDDHLIQQHPEFKITKEGQMRDHIGPDPVDFFLEFFPLELLRPRFEFRKQRIHPVR
jgi:hypothetical protein